MGQDLRRPSGVQKRAEVLEAIHGIVLADERSDEDATALQAMLDVLEDRLGYEYGAVLVLDGASRKLVPCALSRQRRGNGFLATDMARVALRGASVSSGITSWSARNGEVVRGGNVLEETRYVTMRPGIRAEICVPIRGSDRVSGVLNLESPRADAFGEDDLWLLDAVAAHMSYTIQRAKHRRRLSELEESAASVREELHTLSIRSSLIEEEERRRLANGLHDSVGQLLAAAQSRLDGGHETRPEDVAEARDLIGQALDATRTLTFELSSPVLHELGLDAALQNLVERVQRRTGIQFEFIAPRQSRPMAKDRELLLYRIVRELVRNIEEHSEASRAVLQKTSVGNSVRIEVSDNGRGFDTSKNHLASKKYGLISIRHQLEAFGGQFEIESAAEKGTRVTIVVDS